MNSHIEATRLAPVQPVFTVQLSSTRRGARLARLLTVQHLAEWGIPYDSEAADVAALVTAELAANAVRHCGGIGRDFRLRVGLHVARAIRIEVTDSRADRLLPPPTVLCTDGASGHGLVLVDALAARWGSTINDRITKTVWA